jgi:hypothetical protein
MMIENEAPFAGGTVLVEAMDKEIHLDMKVLETINVDEGEW